MYEDEDEDEDEMRASYMYIFLHGQGLWVVPGSSPALALLQFMHCNLCILYLL